jgi:tRNA(fMet)-specific endonuclease VapC
MEIICLDTNVLIAHKRAKKFDKDQTLLFKLSGNFDSFTVSCITVYELLRGIIKMKIFIGIQCLATC